MLEITIIYNAEIPQKGSRKMLSVIGKISSDGETLMRALSAGISFLDLACRKCGGFIRSYATALLA